MKQRFCNLCGKKFDSSDENNGFGIHRSVGYGSKYDMSTIDLDLCCECFDKAIDKLAAACAYNPLTESEVM